MTNILTTPANITELNYVWSQIQHHCFRLISFLFQIQKPLTLQSVLYYGDSANITNGSKDTEMFCFILTFVRENSFLPQRGGGGVGNALTRLTLSLGCFSRSPAAFSFPELRSFWSASWIRMAFPSTHCFQTRTQSLFKCFLG